MQDSQVDSKSLKFDLFDRLFEHPVSTNSMITPLSSQTFSIKFFFGFDISIIVEISVLSE